MVKPNSISFPSDRKDLATNIGSGYLTEFSVPANLLSISVSIISSFSTLKIGLLWPFYIFVMTSHQLCICKVNLDLDLK